MAIIPALNVNLRVVLVITTYRGLELVMVVVAQGEWTFSYLAIPPSNSKQRR